MRTLEWKVVCGWAFILQHYFRTQIMYLIQCNAFCDVQDDRMLHSFVIVNFKEQHKNSIHLKRKKNSVCILQ